MFSPSDTSIALSPNIAELLWRGAAAHDARVAVESRDVEISYAGLMARAAAFAVELRARGVVPGDRVGIFLERGIDAAAAFFGTAAAGGIAVLMADALRPRQVEHVCRHASVRLLIASADLLARQPCTLVPDVPRLDPSDVAIANTTRPIARVSGDVAQIIYTWAAGGAPRGVTVTHGNLWASVQSSASCLRLDATDRIASVLPFSFEYGLNQLLSALWSGGRLIVEHGDRPEDLLSGVRGGGASVLAAAAPLWMQLLATPAFSRAISGLRIMTSAGGLLPAEAVRRLRAAQPQARLVLMYGLTEALRATYLPPDEVDDHPGSIGRAVPGTEVMVLRDDGAACDVDEIGELVHRGPTVGIGYWNDPAATRATFRPNPLRPAGTPDTERVVFSGALVRRDITGRLFLVGRRDSLIETLGHRVNPDDVADALYASSEVVEAVVTAESDGMRGEQLVAVVRLVPGGSLARLRAFCRTELPRHMQPARYQVEEHLPCTASGMYDVAAIQEQVAAFERG